jgi:hypothetical protein
MTSTGNIPTSDWVAEARTEVKRLANQVDLWVAGLRHLFAAQAAWSYRNRRYVSEGKRVSDGAASRQSTSSSALEAVDLQVVAPPCASMCARTDETRLAVREACCPAWSRHQLESGSGIGHGNF